MVTLVPVIGLVQVGMQAGADRYMYLATLGPFMLIALGVSALTLKLKTMKFQTIKSSSGAPAVIPVIPVVSLAACVLAIILLSARTVSQTRV